MTVRGVIKPSQQTVKGSYDNTSHSTTLRGQKPFSDSMAFITSLVFARPHPVVTVAKPEKLSLILTDLPGDVLCHFWEKQVTSDRITKRGLQYAAEGYF